MHGAIAKQRLQNRLGRTKSLDQALNNAKLIRSSKFHDADLWRITNNDETPSFTTDSQNVSDLGLVDSSQAKGSDLTRILDELHLNVEKQVVQVLKPALTLEDPVEVEKDHGVVPENILEGGLVKETTNCQVNCLCFGTVYLSFNYCLFIYFIIVVVTTYVFILRRLLLNTGVDKQDRIS